MLNSWFFWEQAVRSFIDAARFWHMHCTRFPAQRRDMSTCEYK
jgi:hypothetical protein